MGMQLPYRMEHESGHLMRRIYRFRSMAMEIQCLSLQALCGKAKWRQRVMVSESNGTQEMLGRRKRKAHIVVLCPKRCASQQNWRSEQVREAQYRLFRTRFIANWGGPTNVRRTSVGRASDVRRTFVGCPSDVRRTFVGRASDVRRTFVGRPSAVCRTSCDTKGPWSFINTPFKFIADCG